LRGKGREGHRLRGKAGSSKAQERSGLNVSQVGGQRRWGGIEGGTEKGGKFRWNGPCTAGLRTRLGGLTISNWKKQ